MKIPEIAIKSVTPYIKKNKHTHEKVIYLEIELKDNWKKLFESFSGNINIKLRYYMYTHLNGENRFYYGQYIKIVKIGIKNITRFPKGYVYEPNNISKKFTSSLRMRKRIVKAISRIKFTNKKDIAKLKMISRRF